MATLYLPPVTSRPVLVLATLNRAKGRELIGLLGPVPYEVRILADWPGASAPEESADSYAGNALIKARAAVQRTGCLVLADDSGLEVDALGGAPGLRSARYGGPGLSDGERVRLLLDNLRGIPASRRAARFRCAIAIAEPGGRERQAEGSAEGVVIEVPRGTGGFGYDSVFFYEALQRTFAQLTEGEKARVSHRGLAVAAARRLLPR